MKSPTLPLTLPLTLTFLLVLVLALLTTPAHASGYAMTADGKCQSAHPNIYNAIDQLCRGGISTPSDRANNGVTVANRYAAIKNGGLKNGKVNSKACSPAMWVPEYWCRMQFFSICNGGAKKNGMGSKSYGSNGNGWNCQGFIIGEK